MLLYVIERFLLHFAWSVIITGGVFMIIRMLLRRNWKYSKWLPVTILPQLFLAGVIWPGFFVCREAWDVLNGQPIIKAITDDLSWLVAGSLIGIWLLYRYGEEYKKG
jgi:hypothetical protein